MVTFRLNETLKRDGPQMRRPPSYSDSFLVLPGTPGAGLTPLVIPDSSIHVEPEPEPVVQSKWPQRICIFIFKGSLHILFISAFETAFYFLYVNASENAGILNTINTYYQPLVADCGSRWSNETRWLVAGVLDSLVNVSAVDRAGAADATTRAAYNHGLLVLSTLYSVGCFCLCGLIAVVVWCRGWDVPWRRILLENLLFVGLLGAYEVFFFRTIIYNYDTLSTAELNRYIVDGLAECASGSGL